MRLVDPTFGRHVVSAADTKTRATGPLDWARSDITLFSNTKPNARELLEGVAGRLRAVYPGGPISFASKDGASTPADPALIAEVAARSPIALLALGD